MDLVQLLVWVIVGGLLWYLVTILPLPGPLKIVAEVIVILICILALLGYVPITGGHALVIR